jgi:hypothetical protein
MFSVFCPLYHINPTVVTAPLSSECIGVAVPTTHACSGNASDCVEWFSQRTVAVAR